MASMHHATSGRAGYANTSPISCVSRTMNETSSGGMIENVDPAGTLSECSVSNGSCCSNGRPATATVVHDGVNCDNCEGGIDTFISGIRYKCSTCPNFNLCESCMVAHDDCSDNADCLTHPQDHFFLRIARPLKLEASPALQNRDDWKHNVSCAECLCTPIVGYRYFCTSCGISFCESCEQKGLPKTTSTTSHSQSHNLLKMGLPPAAPSNTPKSKTAAAPATTATATSPSCASGRCSSATGSCALPPPPRPSYVDLAQYGITHETLKAMLRREDELRLCPETLHQYATQGDGSYVPITTALQGQVGREFGLSEELGTMLLRCADSFARSDSEHAEIVSLSLYRRHNRCVDGNLREGQRAPALKRPVHLLDEGLTPVHLFDHLLLSPNHEDIHKFSQVFGTTVPCGGSLVGQAVSKIPLILFAGSYS